MLTPLDARVNRCLVIALEPLSISFCYACLNYCWSSVKTQVFCLHMYSMGNEIPIMSYLNRREEEKKTNNQKKKEDADKE